MESYVILVTNKEGGIQGAFAEADRVAALAGLNEKEKLHLRLLTEETMSLVRSVTGDLNAAFSISWEGKAFELHLSTKQKLGNLQRSQLINSTTSKTNEAAQSFLGKLREIFEQAMSVGHDIDNYYSASGESRTVDISDYIITHDKKWDEYERSILLTLADNVRIGIRGGTVDLTIEKKFE